MSGGNWVRGAIARGYRVDLTAVVEALGDGFVSSESAATVIARLRIIADEIESEVLALREGRDGAAQREHGEPERFEGAVAEVRTFPVIHRPYGIVSVVRRVLGVLLHRASERVSRTHKNSCSVVDGAGTPSVRTTVQASAGSETVDTRAGAVPPVPAPARDTPGGAS